MKRHFIFGVLNDFPISNLLINTSLGEILFPYNFANRQSYISYKPNAFLRMFSRKVAKIDARPVFLAIHFCLPHYPYVWGSYTGGMHPNAEIDYSGGTC